jgi:hypothetical protein
MIVPFVLLVLSVAGIVAAFAQPGRTDLLLLAGPCALASLYLLARAAGLRLRGTRWIVVDGSNVLYWKDGTPQIETVKEVVNHLTRQGFTPGVVFDANVGYKIADRYYHDWALGKLLGLTDDRVMVVAKGTPADQFILAAAHDLGARIVTNDRYRDWLETNPGAAKAGYLVRGGFKEGKLWLDL